MKKRIIVLAMLVGALALLMLAVTALAGYVVTYTSSPQYFSGGGWAGWSCGEGETVVSGLVTKLDGVSPPDFPLAISKAANPADPQYPVYPHYTYTPPEEGWVVQNGKARQDLLIHVTCEFYELCDDVFRLPNEVTYSEWSAWVWDADRGLYVSNRIKYVTKTWVDDRNREHVCRTATVEYPEERTRGPDETVVDVGLKCCMPEDGVVYQLHGHIDIAPPGGATVTFDGTDYTETGFIYAGFGTRSWSAVANPGFTLIGDSEGSFTILEEDCNEAPPEHPPTGANPDLALPVAAGIAGLTLLAMGARMVFARKRDEA